MSREKREFLYGESLTTEEIFKNPYFQEWLNNPTLDTLGKYLNSTKK